MLEAHCDTAEYTNSHVSTGISENSEPIVKLRTVGIALTMQCNFECAHCITESSPHVHAALADGESEHLIDQIPGSSSHVCFTGGETTLKLQMLLRGIKQGRDVGLIPTIVTNGHWAKNEERTASMLEKLAEAGLLGICVSLDRFHLDFVASENAVRIAKLSGNYGIKHIVRICYTKGDDFAHSFIARHKDEGMNLQAVKVLRLGRARSLPLDMFEAESQPPDHRCGTVNSPLVLPDGLVQACCGPGIDFSASNPLNLGNWRKEPLRDILRRGRSNPFVMIMNNRGPMELVRQLQARGWEPTKSDRRASYSSICDLCIDLLNCRHTVAAANACFSDDRLQMQLIAGQAYQQAIDLLRSDAQSPEVAG